MTTFVGKEQVDKFRSIQILSALKLECLGMRHSRGSIYAMVKRERGFKGNKLSVLKQYLEWFKTNVDADGPLVQSTEKFLKDKGVQ